MRRYLITAFFFALLPFSASASPVYVSEIEGEIKAGTVQYINRVIMEAESGGASHLVLKIDTPGGLLDSTRRIINALERSPVDTVVFVNKPNGWAYSAGSFILLSADHAFVHPEASIGAAEPRIIGGTERDEKITRAMASWIRGLAAGKGRDANTAEKFVTENLTITGREALDLEVIDGVASDLDELFSLLEITDPETVFVRVNTFEMVFNLLSHPYLVSLFLTLGMLGLVFAFRTGEFEIVGVMGAMLLVIGLWGSGVINFNTLGVILLALGVFLLAIELFAESGFGALGVLGVISLSLGIFNFGAEPFLSPRVFDLVTLFVIGMMASLLIFFVITGKEVAKTIKSSPVTGPESMIGKKGRALGVINPSGRVEVDRESWAAVSKEKIEKNSLVEVVGLKGNTLEVRLVEK